MTIKLFIHKATAVLMVLAVLLGMVPIIAVMAYDASDLQLISDETLPTLESVSPAEGTVVLSAEGTFVWEVDALDAGDNLYELEIDHSMWATIPEFSVYASESNPYGTPENEAEFAAAGVTVEYDGTEQKWTIDFGETVTDAFVANGGITFYVVLKDEVGNQWGTMYGTTPENTFAYTITRSD